MADLHEVSIDLERARKMGIEVNVSKNRIHFGIPTLGGPVFTEGYYDYVEDRFGSKRAEEICEVVCQKEAQFIISDLIK